MLRILTSALFLIFSSTVAHGESAKKCSPMSFDELRKEKQQSGDKPIKLVFFASWCGSCFKELTSPQPENTLYVSIFDEPERAEKVMTKLGIQGRCVLDHGIGKALGIAALPATTSF